MLRLAFMGTPDFAVPALKALLAGPHKVVAVYTREPQPKGRGHEVQKSPVHLVAEAAGIPVHTPRTLKNPEEQARFAALNLDMAVVAAYGLLLPQAILSAPRRGCLNLHGSLLPRWRGAAPIHRAILAGDTQTGICLMDMEAGLDTGGVYASATLPIDGTTTAQSLHDAMAARAATLLTEHLEAIAAGTLPCIPQPADGMTYAAKLEKHEARIDWQRSAAEIDRQIRAFTPWPGAEFILGKETLKVREAKLTSGSGTPGTILDDNFTVACGQGALQLTKVQRPGRSAVDGAACLRGLHITPGTLLPAS